MCRTENIAYNYYLLGGGKNAHSVRLVVAAFDARSDVAAVVARQMAFMDDLPPTCVATFFADAFSSLRRGSQNGWNQ